MLSRVMRSSILLAALATAIAAPSSAFAQPPAALPPLPGPYAVPPPLATPPAQQAQTPQSPVSTAAATIEHARRGIVMIERGGGLLGLGTVLSGDGRILTSLSALAGAESPDVHYADGTVVHARIGHSDKAMDLALLVPQSGKWTDGLTASEADPAGGELRAVSAPHAGRPLLVPAAVKGKVETRAGDGDPLPSMLDVDVKGPTAAGAPLLDAMGGVVGVLVHACKPAAPEATAPPSFFWGPIAVPVPPLPQIQQAQPPHLQAQPPAAQPKPAPCTPVVMGAPVPSIRHFLARTPANAVIPSPWLGIRGEADQTGATRGVRVIAIAPSSPADKGGLKANLDRNSSDLIVAVDGQPVDTPEKLAEAIGKRGVGDTVKLLVLAQDKFRDVSVTLRPAP
jgi:serine protease Do